MNQKILKASLLGAKDYASLRDEWKKLVIPFKKLRTVHIGNHVSLIFENELTVRYQLQEMMRVDKSLALEGLDHELAVYNDLIPEEGTLKATLMFQFVDPDVRKAKLEKMLGAQERVWIKAGDAPKVFGIPSDLDKPLGMQTAVCVYFLTFQLDKLSRQEFLKGMPVAMGLDHPAYQCIVEEIAPETQAVLMEDLKPEMPKL